MKNNTLVLKLDEEFELDLDLIDLLPSYLFNVRKDYDEMGVSLKNSDFQKVAKIAHKIKGSAKSYGFDYIDELMLVIQEDIKDGGASLKELYGYFEKFLNKVEKKLSKA